MDSRTDPTNTDNVLAEGIEHSLVEAIQKYPVLYDRNDANNLNFEKHQTAWNSISDELHLDVENCKTFWKCIKQKFIKYRKRFENGEGNMKVWSTYYMLLPWLDGHIKKRRSRQDFIKQIKRKTVQTDSQTSSNFDDEIDETMDDDLNSQDWNEIVNNKNNITSNSTVTILNSNHNNKSEKRKIIETPHHQHMTTIPRKSFKLEIINESADDSEADIFTELDQNEINNIESEATVNNTIKLHIEKTEPLQSFPMTKVYISKSIEPIATETVNVINAQVAADITTAPRKSPSVATEITTSTTTAMATAPTTPTTPTTLSATNVLNPLSELNLKREQSLKSNDNTNEQLIILHNSVINSFKLLETTIEKCVNLTEKFISEQQQKDSYEIFGKYIASLIRELPAEKTLKIRTEILQYTSELIAKEL